jgi:hypothetical protein
MKNLRKFIEEDIGIPFATIPMPENLVPIFGNAEKSYLFGTEAAKKETYLVQGAIGSFIESAPEGYFLFGHWGHGVNSYALYYCRVDSWSRIFLRLSIGGVYMDNEMEAENIRNFLHSFLKFEKAISAKTKSLLVVDSIDMGHYRVDMLDGRTIERKGSLYPYGYKEFFASVLSELERRDI